MAIGDTVQAGLMRVDSSPILLAGQAQAKANQAFGDAIGGVIEKFYQKKKDKQERDEREQAYLKMGLSSEEAKVASRDKDLANQFINKMNADQNYNLELNKFNLAKDLRDLQMSQIRQAMENQKTDRKEDEISKAKDLEFNEKLLSQITSPQAQGQADTVAPGLSAFGNPDVRNRFMQAQLQQPQNQVPVSSLGFQDFGRFASREGLDPTRSVTRMEALRKAELDRQPKPMTPQEVADLQQTILENRGLEKDLNTPTSIELTEGEKALDKKFADEMTEFNLPDINKGLDQLTEASDALSKSDTLTGPIVSLMPKFISDRLNPKAAEVREAVEEVVQRNLRLVLGSQFTEKEGERLISRAYNPALDESENKKRVERLIKSIRDAAQEKINMRTYFSKNGTLKGYDFTPVTLESIERNAFSQDGITSNLNPADIQSEIERKKQMLRARQMNAQYFDNPNVPNYGPQ